MLDATCAPSNIRYPQDFSLLNEAREKLENIIIRFCKTYGFSRPRMYRKQARKNYLALAKTKKRSTKKIRATIRKQLSYIRRDIRYLESYMEKGYAPTAKEIPMIRTIYKLYEQQQYMYKNKVHSVENRIVSLSQPWIRPIVRGKTKAPVEFGAKFHPNAVKIGWDFPFVSLELQNRFGLRGYVAAYVLPEGFETDCSGVEFASLFLFAGTKADKRQSFQRYRS